MFEDVQSEPTYFECHVTCAPDFDRLSLYKTACEARGFHVAKLLMRKGETLEPSDLDMFCTARSQSLVDLQNKMRDLVRRLSELGFRVWRAKIEVAILDEIYVPKAAR